MLRFSSPSVTMRGALEPVQCPPVNACAASNSRDGISRAGASSGLLTAPAAQGRATSYTTIGILAMLCPRCQMPKATLCHVCAGIDGGGHGRQYNLLPRDGLFRRTSCWPTAGLARKPVDGSECCEPWRRRRRAAVSVAQGVWSQCLEVLGRTRRHAVEGPLSRRSVGRLIHSDVMQASRGLLPVVVLVAAALPRCAAFRYWPRQHLPLSDGLPPALLPLTSPDESERDAHCCAPCWC
ncbi:hypothetical protein IQ07DRAFT_394194 [Pyrenochaeta sp. DS3sAY3a]|nr:hypothetical protein IQ07DRAFT_394194 [Pyrenochaeta sp. DS3sAY3a]